VAKIFKKVARVLKIKAIKMVAEALETVAKAFKKVAQVLKIMAIKMVAEALEATTQKNLIAA